MSKNKPCLQAELRIDSVRELEDLIIEGSNENVLRGKLDQRSSQFEVDFAMARDIQRVRSQPLSVLTF